MVLMSLVNSPIAWSFLVSGTRSRGPAHRRHVNGVLLLLPARTPAPQDPVQGSIPAPQGLCRAWDGRIDPGSKLALSRDCTTGCFCLMGFRSGTIGGVADDCFEEACNVLPPCREEECIDC